MSTSETTQFIPVSFYKQEPPVEDEEIESQGIAQFNDEILSLLSRDSQNPSSDQIAFGTMEISSFSRSDKSENLDNNNTDSLERPPEGNQRIELEVQHPSIAFHDDPFPIQVSLKNLNPEQKYDLIVISNRNSISKPIEQKTEMSMCIEFGSKLPSSKELAQLTVILKQHKEDPHNEQQNEEPLARRDSAFGIYSKTPQLESLCPKLVALHCHGDNASWDHVKEWLQYLWDEKFFHRENKGRGQEAPNLKVRTLLDSEWDEIPKILKFDKGKLVTRESCLRVVEWLYNLHHELVSGKDKPLLHMWDKRLLRICSSSSAQANTFAGSCMLRRASNGKWNLALRCKQDKFEQAPIDVSPDTLADLLNEVGVELKHKILIGDHFKTVAWEDICKITGSKKAAPESNYPEGITLMLKGLSVKDPPHSPQQSSKKRRESSSQDPSLSELKEWLKERKFDAISELILKQCDSILDLTEIGEDDLQEVKPAVRKRFLNEVKRMAKCL